MSSAPQPVKRRSMSLDPSAVHRKQLTVSIIEAKGVGSKKDADKISAYCVVSCNNVCFRTNPQAGTKPEWKQKFTFNAKDIQDVDATLSIVCWSHQKYSKDAFLGQVEIPLTSLNGNIAIKQWWPFAPRDDSDKNVSGKVNLEIQLITDTSVVKKKNSAIGKKLKRRLSWEEKKTSDGETGNAFETAPTPSTENQTSPPATKAEESSSSSSSSGDSSEPENGKEKPSSTDHVTPTPETQPEAAKPASEPRDDDTDAESMVLTSNVRDSIELNARRNDDGTDTEGGIDVDQLRAAVPRSPRRTVQKDDDEDIAFPPKGAKRKGPGAKPDGTETDTAAHAVATDGEAAIASDAPVSVVSKMNKKRMVRPSIDSNNPATDSGAESSEAVAVVRPVVPPKGGAKKKKPAVPKKAMKVTTPPVPGLEHQADPSNSEDKSNKEERSGSGQARSQSADPQLTQPSDSISTSSQASSSSSVKVPGATETPASATKEKPAAPVRKKSSIFSFVSRLGSVLKTTGGKTTPSNTPVATPVKTSDPTKSGATPATTSATPATSMQPTQPLTVEEILQQKPEVDSSEELLGSDDDSGGRPGVRRGGKPAYKRRAKKQPASGDAVIVRVALGSSGGAAAPAPAPASATGPALSKSPSSNAVTTEPISPRREVKDMPLLPPKASAGNLSVAPPTSPRKPTSTDNDDSSGSSSSDESDDKQDDSAAAKELEQVKAAVATLRADYSVKVEELTSQRESLKEDVSKLKQQVADLERQVDSKTKVIEEKDKTIEVLRKEQSVPIAARRNTGGPNPEVALLEGQLRREIEQREMAEKKALEYMNQFLQMTNVVKQRSDKDTELVNKVLALENELSRLRRQLAAATTAAPASAPANGDAASSTAAPAVAAANASFEFDFSKERRMFEEMFERGRKELLDVIEQGKASIVSAVGGDDSEVPTDNEKIDISLPRKKKRMTKTNSARSNRASSVSDNDSASAITQQPARAGLTRIASVSVNETALKIELDQLRKELSSVKQANSELTSRLSTLQRRNSVNLSAPTGVPVPVNRPVVAPIPTTQPGTGAPLSARTESARGESARDPNPSSEGERSGSPVATRVGSMTSPRPGSGSQELSAMTASPPGDDVGPLLSTGKKAKKLKSVRFHGDVSSDEQGGKGPSWRDNVRKTLGIPKKKPAPGQGPSPWRKPPETAGVPFGVKKPNKVEWNRTEQSYWSDDVDSDTYGPGGATSGNESMPNEYPAHRQADDSDFSENEYGGSDGGSASGSLPRGALLPNLRDTN